MNEITKQINVVLLYFIKSQNAWLYLLQSHTLTTNKWLAFEV